MRSPVRRCVAGSGPQPAQGGPLRLAGVSPASQAAVAARAPFSQARQASVVIR